MASSRPLIKALSSLLLLCCSSIGQTAELVLHLERAAMPGIQVEDMELILDWPEKRSPQAVTLRMSRIVMQSPALELSALEYRCQLSFDAAAGPGCEGPVAWRDDRDGAHSANLKLGIDALAINATLSLSAASLTLAWPREADLPVRIAAENMPAAWLQGELQALWPGARLTDGVLGGRFELVWNANDALAISGRLQAAGLGFDTDDGSVAAAGVNAHGALEAVIGDRLQVSTDLQIEGGELLFDRFYAELPGRPLQFVVRADEEGDGRWQIRGIRLADNGIFDLVGEMGLNLTSENWLQRADLRLAVADAGEVVARYADSLLGLAGLSGLRAEGEFDANLRLDAGRLRALDVEARSLYLLDAGGRFALDAASGSLALGPDSAVREDEIRWDAASLYRVPLGPLRLSLRSGAEGIELLGRASVAVLGGQLFLERLHWRQEDGEDTDLEASLGLEQLDLASLSAAFDWPPFGGQLSGRIPAVRYDEGILSFDGGLQVGVFDGKLDIDSLSMERPFGVLPTLNADIRFASLDLLQMTQVFDIGEIQGRLMGSVLGLRLIDWEPVAFDAVLRTEKGAGTRRISQRAVDSLSSVGGGGGIAALQSSVLRVFSSFGYDEIGLSCRLRNHVCHMDGVDSAGQGYAIVKGSGLPRISVVGHQRQVDWPVLLSRLKAATTGAGPVMN